jgi:hypothetical protein
MSHLNYIFNIQMMEGFGFTDQEIVHLKSDTEMHQSPGNGNTSINSSGRFSVHVWVWMCVLDPGVCWRVEGSFNRYSYIGCVKKGGHQRRYTI